MNSPDDTEGDGPAERFRSLAEEYETLLAAAEDGIFLVDVESDETGYVFRFGRLNRAYEERTGVATDEASGRTPTEVFGDDVGADLRANYERCVEAREPITYDERVPEGRSDRVLQTKLTPVVSDGEVTRIIGITRNVTDRVQRERRLQAQKTRLDEFAGIVSHDLRNPLMVAQSRADLLAEECQSDHLPHIVQSLDRMDVLVSDTLALARQGRVVDDLEPVDVTGLIDECWAAVPTDRATLETEDDLSVVGDPDRLRHVFENLFRNAVEHAGPDVTVRVGRVDADGFYVEDTGPGIPDDARDGVFEPSSTAESGGTGLGLSIVGRISEAHGWDVAITSGVDGGARFEFTGVDAVQQ